MSDIAAIIACILIPLIGGVLVWPLAREIQHSTDDRRAAVHDGYAATHDGYAANDRRRAEATARFYADIDSTS